MLCTSQCSIWCSNFQCIVHRDVSALERKLRRSGRRLNWSDGTKRSSFKLWALLAWMSSLYACTLSLRIRFPALGCSSFSLQAFLTLPSTRTYIQNSYHKSPPAYLGVEIVEHAPIASFARRSICEAYASAHTHKHTCYPQRKHSFAKQWIPTCLSNSPSVYSSEIHVWPLTHIFVVLDDARRYSNHNVDLISYYSHWDSDLIDSGHWWSLQVLGKKLNMQ